MTEQSKTVTPTGDLLPRKPRTRSAFIKQLGLALLTLVVGLFIVEGVVRLFNLAPALRAIDTSDPDSPYKRSDNPILGYEHKANYRNANADLITSIPRTNAHGQRDVERSVEKPAGVRRVILLGDSVVESMEVRDIEQVMHRQLERLYPANSVEVLNFGVNGYCTLAEIELLRVKGLAFKPDVVVVVFVDNDFDSFNAAVHAFATDRRRPGIVNGLFKRSHLFRSICLRLNLFGFAAQRNPAVWNTNAIGGNNVVTGLAMLRELADREGFEPVVAIWPTFEENRIVDGPLVEDGDRTLIIEQFAGFHGIPCFRLSGSFARDHATRGATVGPSDTYTIGDGMHANEEGSRVAALALRAVLDALDDPSRAVQAPPSAAAYARTLAKMREMDRAQAEGVRRQSIRFDELVSTADSLAEHGRLEEAIPLYAKAIAMDTEFSPRAHEKLANALQAAGRYQEAIPHYRELLRVNPGYASTHHNWGVALDALGRPQDAIDHYQEAVLIKPDGADTHFNLGNSLRVLGRHQEAVNHYEQVVQLQPDYVDAHVNWALALHSLGRFEAAITRGLQAVRLNPDHSAAHNNLAIMYRESGRLAEAIKHFEEAVRVSPDNASAREGLRVTRAMMKRGMKDEG
ncbi:MAG: tetratricopeptide repeat protein [Verrucomicrobia bacterium]|jgi:tetratricopeptide (TPR) repeat protein|nr:tetratricopeptide repeat protein [Verrucomicrobiota bacterium]